jgi:hypothetical protein
MKKKKRKVGSGRHKNHHRKCTSEEIVHAINEANGFLSLAAEKLGITYQSLWVRRKRDKKIRKAIAAVREKHLDFSESKLLKNIKKGKEQSIFFHLRCLGQQRGYGDKLKIGGIEGSPIQLTVESRLTEISRKREVAIKEAIQRGEFVGDRNFKTETGEEISGNGHS